MALPVRGVLVSTRSSYVVRVDYVTEWEGDDLPEARRQYEQALTEAHVDEEVVLQLVVHSVIDLREGEGVKEWPEAEPGTYIDHLITVPKIEVRRGGIEYKRSQS